MATDLSVDETLYLVILEESPEKEKKSSLPQSIFDEEGKTTEKDRDPRIASLQKELQEKEEYLQASNEELKLPTKS